MRRTSYARYSSATSVTLHSRHRPPGMLATPRKTSVCSDIRCDSHLQTNSNYTYPPTNDLDDSNRVVERGNRNGKRGGNPRKWNRLTFVWIGFLDNSIRMIETSADRRRRGTSCVSLSYHCFIQTVDPICISYSTMEEFLAKAGPYSPLEGKTDWHSTGE